LTNLSGRRVTANMSLTIDGRYNGPGGATDLSHVVPYAVTDLARDHMTRIWENATTAVLGRINAEGFLGFWPSIADNEQADPRDRGYAKWLVEAEKLVFSTTLTVSPWEGTRLVNAPASEVIQDLKAKGEGDILVNSSASLIKALLAADMLDRLYLMICPEIAGAGERLFEDGLPASKWTLVRMDAGERGELALIYDRAR
jgi:dihydrofolate reductase